MPIRLDPEGNEPTALFDFAGSLAGKRVLYECDTLDREMREKGERHERSPACCELSRRS